MPNTSSAVLTSGAVQVAILKETALVALNTESALDANVATCQGNSRLINAASDQSQEEKATRHLVEAHIIMGVTADLSIHASHSLCSFADNDSQPKSLDPDWRHSRRVYNSHLLID